MKTVMECDYAAVMPPGEEHERCREALINEGAGVNVMGEDGLTPLMFAVQQDHVQCVNELIKKGADVNAEGSRGFTPLIMAVRLENRSKYTELLIDAGADVNKKDKFSRDALYHSANKRNDTLIETFLKAGADVNSRYADGYSPLFIAVRSQPDPDNRYTKKRPEQLRCVNILIQAGADVNAKARNGDTPLMSAAENNFTKCIDRLIKAGADVNAVNKDGETGLIYAAAYGSVKCIKILLEAGADVNKGQNQHDGTALMIASHYGKYESVNVLLKAGADVNARNYNDSNALHILADQAHRYPNYHLKCAKKLLRAGIHINRFSRVYTHCTVRSKIALEKALEHRTWVKEEDAEIYSDILMFLYAAGETLEGTDVDKIPEVLKFEEEKLKLKHICREAIRKHLPKLDPHEHLFGRIFELGLPSVVTEYLLFNQSLDDDNDNDGDDDDEVEKENKTLNE